MLRFLYRMLEIPWFYRLSQFLLAPGSQRFFHRYYQHLFHKLPYGEFILDVGCGPKSLLWSGGLHPIGLDYSHHYTKSFFSKGDPAVTASADYLPFKDNSLDSVWSFGLLHHLDDEQARKTLLELRRILKRNGYIVVMDNVMPQIKWRRPLAYLLRRLDRGNFVRSQEALESLLPDREYWNCDRVTYCVYGLEGLFCVFHRNSMGTHK